MAPRQRIVLASFSILLAACGGAPEAATPASPAQHGEEPSVGAEEREPRTVEEAQDRIARLRADLEGPRDDRSKDAPSADAKPSPPKTPSAGGPAERIVDACARPCSALASMRRAVEALCRMTGDADKRCTDARKTLGESVDRTSSCGCEKR